ncbi:hypothetical protein AB0G54_37075 [Streptomyces yokosukanensis]|uniref:hypothetical protein n=1 Tax=Streptomyces yokosukanensis TaxID=67386 RepID=UPI00343709CC
MDETTGAAGGSPEPAPAPTPPADEPRGFLASALTPIAPAHPAADDADDETAGSSADYHAGDYEETEEGAAAQGDSVMRAFLMAAVERWRKGAGANVKALEVEKAKAQARQTRTNHTISENRVGGATTTNTNENKGNKDAKSANNRTHAVNNANQAKSNRDDKNASNHNRDDKNHRQNQGKVNRDDKTSSNKDDKSSSAKDSSAKTSKDGKTHNTDSKNSGDSKTSSDSKTAKGDQRTTTVHDGEGGGALAPNRKTDPKAGKPIGQNQRPGTTEEEKGQPGQQQPNGQQSPQLADTTPAAGTRPRTQTAREAGYRDGHRAARGVAQVRAYVDGTRDGYTDGTEQATKEKVQLDKARDDRKQQRADAQQNPQQTNTSGEQQPVSDTNNVVPITVKGIDKERVYLGDGAARESMTRGEVRSLKTFERRLKARSAQMIKAADVLKALVAYEKEQARKAAALAEKAKSVKGGEKLIPKLQRMAEAAKQEAAAAEEAHKQAVRAAESVKVLLANVEKRDGLIYKAVVDSPETMPAEMAFYQEAA